MRSKIRLFVLLAGLGVLSGCGESPEEAKFRQELVEKALNDDTRKEGDAFIRENSSAEGVVTTKSGLQYKVIHEGEGRSPTSKDTVTVHYEGMRIDGHIFDSSYKRGKPTTFPLNRVIKGWTEGLSLMKKGGVRMLYIPPELAYGALSPSEDIPANSTLIFKVELIDFHASE
ncbi:FKBP-type peptidyl-prolyl cis-trans isomerase [Neptuniibacter caesariensis]|uniref:Peptidyl-prolyl cis-trans isomerase n=1 Tax=Neptuniibacter caesariensis TaxID=207954 RepID=A0A7U8C3Q2_NEPCE|nr:FKBP-type peptidyl-prolyl cis-trans isomerase [Neptuniibacter caesariensis]EAR60917.1 FKBP-type peptidyl-prolyl cis-trans isomerase [Oceanospirillum sp. MED92] [Neptuniibacter caesariensis]